jgi:hypothetical protein
MGETAMVKKASQTTRRGFVKGVAAGSTAAIVAGTLMSGCSAQSGKKSLEARLDVLEKRLQQVEDIQAIQRLQYAYNYYVEHMMKQEIIDCFSDSSDVLLDWLEGKWKGKAGVRKYFNVNQVPPVGFQHQLIPSAGLITVAPDGKMAKGRWYAFGGIMMPAPAKEGQPTSFTRSFIAGIYEIGYIKEDGIWKLLTINWVIPYGVRIKDGWILPEDIAGPMLRGQSAPGAPQMVADIPMDKGDLRYVTGYIFPSEMQSPSTIPLMVRPSRMVCISRFASTPTGATPINPQVPPIMSESTACRNTFGIPVHSSVYSMPPPVRFLISSTAFTFPELMVWVAPNSFASLSRSSRISTPMIFVQPLTTAARMALNPTDPMPKTAIEDPGSAFSELMTPPAPV